MRQGYSGVEYQLARRPLDTKKGLCVTFGQENISNDFIQAERHYK